MALNVYYDKDADLSIIKGKKVAIIGYGSQGHAHATNLNDSGVDVVVGLRANSSSVAKAEAHGLKVSNVADAVAASDIVMILTPDDERIQDVGITPDLNIPKPALDYELPGHDETKLPTLTLGATRDDPAVKLGLEILKKSLLLQDASEEELDNLTPEQAVGVKRFNGLQKALQEITR